MKMTKELLRGLPIFSGLTSFECDHIASLCRLTEGKAGDRLILEGQPVRILYFLLSGEMAIVKEYGGEAGVVIATVGKGTVLGEMALIENLPASATVEAKGPFQALAIDLTVFNRLIDNFPHLGYKIFKKLAQITSYRLRLAGGQLAEYKMLQQPPENASEGK